MAFTAPVMASVLMKQKAEKLSKNLSKNRCQLLKVRPVQP
jgi:hypothetical protein